MYVPNVIRVLLNSPVTAELARPCSTQDGHLGPFSLVPAKSFVNALKICKQNVYARDMNLPTKNM